MPNYTQSLIPLIAANFIPIFGVTLFGWSVGSIMLLYWLENIVIGYFNVLRMKRSKMSDTPNSDVVKQLQGSTSGNISAAACKTKQCLIKFFISHYGGFTVVHGIFTLVIFFGVIGQDFYLAGTLIGIIGLFVSHGISYKVNFINKKEYARVSTQRLFNQPYRRIIILHLVVVLGAFLVLMFNSPTAALVLLITLKIGADMKLHIKEHRSFENTV